MQLRRGDVLDGAMAILDEFGLADLTMRRLATALGVQPGALYWHFPNKQTLLGALADKILEDVDAPVTVPGWDAEFTELAHRLRTALLAHRDGAELVSATYASRMTNSRVRESFAAVGLRSGLSREHAELSSYSLLYYVLGHTVDEQSRAQMESAGALTRAALSPDAPQSQIAAYDEDLLDGDPAVRFDFGLSLFVDGIRARLKDSAHRP
ncbi:TetR/AcrR family transcriptional regulator C-terminal domain-containing protein [Rhodococcus sp. T2V]|uniref:TetR/AcrR family transcriptional regulator C-terminal domain-containing protein n=1 Tax=Rhodococcus sp. T2V TaxID=3034164 RepID=UPI0023E344E5|nr:TetR/AcrR family transcriptional regulator C-terminal domain-containing protein [Rhodococcus sp. T2V]MDF3306078.1 TetR/AcrR family transcriptional regulator C-terminal domain-containing protein [Rhodococcus sp. T2V]